MITVIKPGKLSKKKYYIGKCWCCETKIIFEEDDLKTIDKNKYVVDRGPDLYQYIDCPECDTALVKSHHDFEEIPKYRYVKLLRKAKRRNINEYCCNQRREVRAPRK